MVNIDSVTISTLINLRDVSRQAQLAFRNEARRESNSELKMLYEHYSDQRKHFVKELNKTLKDLSKANAPVDSNPDEEALIAESDYDDEKSLEVYEEAMRTTLPEDVAEIVERQHDEIQEAKDRISQLKDSTLDVKTEGNSDTEDTQPLKESEDDEDLQP
jgi:hypothetical protein